MEAAARAGRLRVLVAQWTRIREVFRRRGSARPSWPQLLELDGAVGRKAATVASSMTEAASMRGQALPEKCRVRPRARRARRAAIPFVVKCSRVP